MNLLLRFHRSRVAPRLSFIWHPFQPVRHYLDQIQVSDPRYAHLICHLIPPQCPFERDVIFFQRKIMHIPALCKLNPFFDEVVALRFRALTFLADTCHEDITPYISSH